MADSPFDPQRDLVLEREVDVAPALIWAAWTKPEHLVHWLAPAPWTVASCDIDLKPGGIFRFVLRSPEGEEFTHENCFLDIQPHSRLVWSNLLLPGYRPAEKPFLGFTAVISIEPHGTGTRYIARAMHKSEGGRKEHADMGFHDGWGTCFDQMIALIKKN